MAAVAALALIAMAVPLLWSSPDMLLTSAAAERELQADEVRATADSFPWGFSWSGCL